MNLHPNHAPRSYAVMDSTLTQYLKGGACNIKVHQHKPNVIHHHVYDHSEAAYVPPEVRAPFVPPEARKV